MYMYLLVWFESRCFAVQPGAAYIQLFCIPERVFDCSASVFNTFTALKCGFDKMCGNCDHSGVIFTNVAVNMARRVVNFTTTL